MPYCCQCGSQVGEADLYCPRCGARQPATGRPAPETEGISPRAASMWCYAPFVGWMAAIIVLASKRFRQDRTVRFHAFQGLYLFVAYLIVDWVVGPLLGSLPGLHFRVDRLLKLGLLAVSVFMIIKTSQDQRFALPIVGELAEKSASES